MLSYDSKNEILESFNETVNDYFEALPQSSHLMLDKWQEIVKFLAKYSIVVYSSMWLYKPQKVMILFSGDIIELSSGDTLEWFEEDREWSFR
jgi:hypothetical protein